MPRISNLLFLLLFYVGDVRAQDGKMEVLPIEEQAVVSLEENFGAGVKTVEQALSNLERIYVPYDGTGRTFAILEATGYALRDGRMHLDIRLSSEKAGKGKLLLKSTKKSVWQCTFTEKGGRKTCADKTLTIYVEQETNGKKQFFTADGSRNPATIFASTLKENQRTVNEVWPDGTSKEVMFVYSACGCPIHVKYRRKGMNTIKQDKSQVVFPDDPIIAATLKKLMNEQ